MNDEFIYQLMPEPRPEFAEDLRLKLTAARIERKQEASDKMIFGSLKSRWKLAVPALAIAGLVLFSMPSVRAAALQALQAITSIAGISFSETDSYPYDGPMQYNEVFLTVEEAREKLGFRFGLPAWLPDEYIDLQTQAMILLGAGESDLARATNVYISWLHRSGDNLVMIAQPRKLVECIECGGVPVGVGSTVEVSINGAPAALTRGYWDPDTETWDDTGVMNLRWATDETLYMLTAVEARISEAELVRIAASIR